MQRVQAQLTKLAHQEKYLYFQIKVSFSSVQWDLKMTVTWLNKGTSAGVAALWIKPYAQHNRGELKSWNLTGMNKYPIEKGENWG